MERTVEKRRGGKLQHKWGAESEGLPSPAGSRPEFRRDGRVQKVEAIKPLSTGLTRRRLLKGILLRDPPATSNRLICQLSSARPRHSCFYPEGASLRVLSAVEHVFNLNLNLYRVSVLLTTSRQTTKRYWSYRGFFKGFLMPPHLTRSGLRSSTRTGRSSH